MAKRILSIFMILIGIGFLFYGGFLINERLYGVAAGKEGDSSFLIYLLAGVILLIFGVLFYMMATYKKAEITQIRPKEFK